MAKFISHCASRILFAGLGLLTACSPDIAQESSPTPRVVATGAGSVAIGENNGAIVMSQSRETAAASRTQVDCGVNNGVIIIDANGVQHNTDCTGKANQQGRDVSATGSNSVAIGVNNGNLNIKR